MSKVAPCLRRQRELLVCKPTAIEEKRLSVPLSPFGDTRSDLEGLGARRWGEKFLGMSPVGFLLVLPFLGIKARTCTMRKVLCPEPPLISGVSSKIVVF